MATLELVERLREYANVSYAEATEALDACNDDILEAIVYLEKQGKVSRPRATQSEDARYSTKAKAPSQKYTAPHASEETFGDLIQRFIHWVGSLIKKSMSNHFTVYKEGKKSFSMPIIILVLSFFLSVGTVLGLLILGLFFGYSYSFGGEDFENSNPINNAMDTASRTADDIKISIKNSQKQNQEKENTDEDSQNHQE